MNPNLKWKIIFILAVIVICIYSIFFYPTFPASFAQLKNNFANQIKLGLDLQGGTHMILQVQVQEAVAQETDQTVDRITSQLRAKNIRYEEVRRADDTHITVRGIPAGQISEFRDLFHQQFEGNWDLGTAPGQPDALLLTLRNSAVAHIQESTMTQSLETIERRINALGLTEPTIQPHGRNENEILVQLPGEGDPTRAKQVIQAGGQLELKLVEDQTTYPSQAAALAAHGGVLPPGSELMRGKNESRNAQNPSDSLETWYLISRTPAVTGRDLRSATKTAVPRFPTSVRSTSSSRPMLPAVSVISPSKTSAARWRWFWSTKSSDRAGDQWQHR